MFPNDLVCRSVLYPRAFSDANVFELATFMRSERRTGTTAMVISVGSRHLLKDVEGAHEYGHRSAIVANQGLVERNGGNPIPEAEVVHYLGFYDIAHWQILAVSAHNHRLEVRYKPERGNDAHFEIELWETGGSKREKRVDRSLIELMLASRLFGPQRKTFATDAATIAELNAIDLPLQSPAEAV